MKIEYTAEILRDGRKPLRPLIEYYSDEGRDIELIYLLKDNEISKAVLYILSEMPSIHASTRAAVEEIVEMGIGDNNTLAFASDILNNSKVRP